MCSKRAIRLVVSQSTQPTVMVRRSIRPVEDGRSCFLVYQITLMMTLENARYAIERTASFIKVFFWSRSNASVPKDVSSPGSTINTDNWVWISWLKAHQTLRYFFKWQGTPAAYFPSSTSCDFAAHLSPFNIVIDLDFCTFPYLKPNQVRIDILVDSFSLLL